MPRTPLGCNLTEATVERVPTSCFLLLGSLYVVLHHGKSPSSLHSPFRCQRPNAIHTNYPYLFSHITFHPHIHSSLDHAFHFLLILRDCGGARNSTPTKLTSSIILDLRRLFYHPFPSFKLHHAGYVPCALDLSSLST